MRIPLWLAIGCSSTALLNVLGCNASLDSDNVGTGASTTVESGGGTASGGGSTVASSGGSEGIGGSEQLDLPGGLSLEGQPEYYRVVRLTHDQWEASVRDIFELNEETGLSSGFSPDPPDGTFNNNERALYVSDTLRLDYQRSAEEVAEMIASDPSKLTLLGANEGASGFIETVGKRAFRRELTADEVSAYQTLWDSGAEFFQSGDALTDGARIFIEALLQSPDFVYRIELSEDGTRLSGNELATKISYILRGTTPSDELLAQAEAGALDTTDGLAQVVTDILEEDRARLALEKYHRELFGLDRYNSILKNTTRFPSYTEELNPILLDADLMFFSNIYTSGNGFREILLSDVAYVNSATAEFYDLTSQSPTLTEVQLDESRPGFLTRLGFLAYNATLNEPDPIHRGVDINNRLLCAKLEPPAGEIPPLPDPVAGQTNRQRVEAHTGEGFCAGCHNGVINPPGFSLEHFDAMGQFRNMDNGQPLDTTGTFAVGTSSEISFTSIADLAPAIAEHPIAHACYTARLTEFVFARDVGSGETDLISAVQDESMNADASLKQMLLTIMTSPEFSTARTVAQ